MNLYDVMKDLVDGDGENQDIEIEIHQKRFPEHRYSMTFCRVVSGDNEVHFIKHGQLMRYYWSRNTRTDFMQRVEVQSIRRKRRLVGGPIIISAKDCRDEY